MKFNIKNIWCFPIMLMVLFSCFNRDQKAVENDLIKANLFGEVKLVKTFQYEVVEKFGEMVKGELKEGHKTPAIWIREYNRKGQILKSARFEKDEPIISLEKHEKEYDNKGNIIRRKDCSGLRCREKKIKYDEYGDIVEVEEYINGNLYKKHKYVKGKLIQSSEKDIFFLKPSSKFKYFSKYKYDEKGNNTEINTYNISGELSSKRVIRHKYDNNGSRVLTVKYNPEGKIEDKYRYNTKGDTIVHRFYDDDNGNPLGKFEYSYNQRRDVISYSEYGTDGQIHRKHVYNDNSDIIEEIYYGKYDAIHVKIEYKYKYDSKGNKVSIMKLSNDEAIVEEKTEYTYDYDSYGNWIKKIKILDGTPVLIEEREIEYYE